MINTFQVSGFKRFFSEEFTFSPLTILAGLNGSGKTSVIHSLLLAREACIGAADTTIRLNGPFGIELGAAEEVRNWYAGENIEFRLSTHSGGDFLWEFAVPSDDALYLNVISKPRLPPAAFTAAPRTFSYLCAERLGPRNILSSSPLPIEFLEVGHRGEYCAQLLAALGNRPLENDARLHPDREQNSPTLLKYEVERWLGEIARPIELDAERYPGSSMTALRYRAPGGDWVRAPNMGFGVSYALPIILAGLIAKPGGLIVVENPEAHLHPAGQSRMGVFLAWLSSRGVQILVETHSDHVLNGIRRAIGEYKYLDHDKAVAIFFGLDSESKLVLHHLKFTPMGGVSNWPSGFFDQYQIDVSSLGRVRRRV